MSTLGWTLMGIATFLLTLRLYSRVMISSDNNWALFWALVAWVCSFKTWEAL